MLGEEFVQLVYDVSSFHNVTLEDAVEMLPTMTPDAIDRCRGDFTRTVIGG